MSPERDLPPDEHLRAALRHAPDAELQAPSDIGERLLAEARRAVRPTAVPPARPWWRRWFSGGTWLPQGALASLLVAGLVTVSWRHEATPGPTVASRAPEGAALPPVPAAPASEAPAVVIAEAAVPKPQPTAPARAARAAAEPTPRAAAKAPPQAVAAAEPSGTAAAAKAAAPAAAADNLRVAGAQPAPALAAPAPTAAPTPTTAPADAPPAALQRLRAPVQAGALRAAASASPPPPWGTAGPLPPALAEPAGRVAGPWRDAAQPAGQPLLAWEHEGRLLGRAWLQRRGDADWLVWCGAATAACHEAPLHK